MADAMMGMGTPEMMPQEAPSEEQFAAFDEIRNSVSPSEFNETMLSTAAEADPMAVAEFKTELRGLDLPQEVINTLNGMVDEILASPDMYQEIKAKYTAQGITEDLLPPEFDPMFFGALNVALDEMSATAGAGARPPQAFARGGIASLGRNGDTMLAHVTPEEMGILKARGGSGTINPYTGLPEFWSLSKVFKKIGSAVKKFAGTTIGKIVIGTALFMIAGPAATAMFGQAAAPALIAATQGFVAGAGTSLIGGASLKDSLKAGAIGALTAGAVKGLTQGSAAFKATPQITDGISDSVASFDRAALPDIGQTASNSASGATTYPGTSTGEGIMRLPIQGPPAVAQEPWSMVNAGTPVAPPIQPQSFQAPAASQGTINLGQFADRAARPGFDAAMPARYAPIQSAQVPLAKAPGFFESVKGVVKPEDGMGRFDHLKDAFLPGKGPSIQQVMDANPGMSLSDAKTLATDMSTSAVRRYAPLAAAGMGVMALGGGFKEQQPDAPQGWDDMVSGVGPGRKLLEQYPEKYGLQFGGTQTLSNTSPGYPTYTPYKAAQGSGPQGVAALSAFPEKEGHISGPGTATSDDIPAMLSDGEFVFTAKAVRGMGNGSRREGAKRMYALMKKLEGRKHG